MENLDFRTTNFDPGNPGFMESYNPPTTNKMLLGLCMFSSSQLPAEKEASFNLKLESK